MKNKSLISLFVGLILFGFGIYTVIFIIKNVDFSTTTVIIRDNPELWKFMAFIPIILCMFTGAMCILNGILNMKTINVISIILLIGTSVFLKYDLWGFVTIIAKYRELMDMLFIVVLALSGFLVLDIILNVMAESKEKKKLKNA